MVVKANTIRPMVTIHSPPGRAAPKDCAVTSAAEAMPDCQTRSVSASTVASTAASKASGSISTPAASQACSAASTCSPPPAIASARSGRSDCGAARNRPVTVVPSGAVSTPAFWHWPSAARAGLYWKFPTAVRITSAVMVHTTMVSMNGLSMAIEPWRCGLRVWALAWAMAAEPRPASLEKLPRLAPSRIAAASAAPMKPPAAALPVNAPVKIEPSAAGTASAFATSTMTEPTM